MKPQTDPTTAPLTKEVKKGNDVKNRKDTTTLGYPGRPSSKLTLYRNVADKTDVNARPANRRHLWKWNKRIRSLCFVCITALLCVVGAAQLIYTYTTIKRLEARLEVVEKDRDALLSMLRKHINDDPTSLQVADDSSDEFSSYLNEANISKRSEKSEKRKDKKKNKKRRNRRSQMTAFVHLRGKSSGRGIYDGSSFLWDKQVGRQYEPRGVSLLAEQEISAIGIQHNGIYLVYAQIMVNGSTSQAEPHHCAHKTTVKRHDGEETVLIKSLITQYNLGQLYISGATHYSPVDSKLQMGVFKLHRRDELRVKFDESCEHTSYMMNPEASYFGVVKIA